MTFSPLHGSQPLLEVQDLRVQFKQNSRCVKAVNGLSYRVRAGGTLAIIGESGSGKTVSCRALMGLLPRTASVSGSVRLNGKELLGLSEHEWRRHRGADIAMVFQDPVRSLNPTVRIGHQITEAIRQHEPLAPAAARDRAMEILERLRVPGARQRFDAYPHELSGGLRQRVLIAIAVACRPQLLIADEATRCLDAITQAETLALLKELQEELGMAIIMISHDLRLAASFAEDVLVMYAGRAVELVPTPKLFSHAHARYTRALVEAVPSIGRSPHSRFEIVPGHPPDLSALPEGCAFEPRCAYASPICRTTQPVLEGFEEDHRWACWHPCTGEAAKL